jgi:hypothetical protein
MRLHPLKIMLAHSTVCGYGLYLPKSPYKPQTTSFAKLDVTLPARCSIQILQMREEPRPNSRGRSGPVRLGRFLAAVL